MDLARRKIVELTHKIASLATEFQDWRGRSEEGTLLQKHHSQIRRITYRLEGYGQEIGQQIPKPVGDATKALAACRDVELDILEIHRIWEFFRAKLVMRNVSLFQSYLFAADEFAWACYAPARQAADPANIPADRVKEPPLVFFNGGSSPFAAARNRSYQAEEVPGETLVNEQLIPLLKTLPIPVIGIPWFQIQHLPDGMVIGHEVGHLVEDDFSLGQDLETHLETALAAKPMPNEHKQAWRQWRREVFADVFGCLAGGPAFVGSLMDFLAGATEVITGEERNHPYWGDYPTAYLRVLICLQCLRDQGFLEEVVSLEKDWRLVYPHHQMTEFEEAVPRVVRALGRQPLASFGGKPLRAVIDYSPVEHAKAKGNAQRLLKRLCPQYGDARSLFAAARLAFAQDPQKYKDYGVGHRVLKAIPNEVGLRSKKRSQVPVDDLDGKDLQAGAALWAEIRKLKKPSPDGAG